MWIESRGKDDGEIRSKNCGGDKTLQRIPAAMLLKKKKKKKGLFISTSNSIWYGKKKESQVHTFCALRLNEETPQPPRRECVLGDFAVQRESTLKHLQSVFQQLAKQRI